MGPILNPHRNCEFEKKKRSSADADRLLSAVSAFMGENVKLVIISTLMVDQPHPDLGVHRLNAIVGEGNIGEAMSMICELQLMVEEQRRVRQQTGRHEVTLRCVRKGYIAQARDIICTANSQVERPSLLSAKSGMTDDQIESGEIQF
jgi:hypothetical protein